MLERDKEELRERYNEKSRQKRRLEEQMGMGGGAASDGRQIAHPQPYTPSPQQHRNQQQQQHSPLFDGGVMQHQNFHTQGGGSAGGSGMHYRHHQRGNQAREQPMQIQYPVPPAQARLPTRAVHSDGHRNNATNVVDRNMGSNPWMSRSPAAMYVSHSLSFSDLPHFYLGGTSLKLLSLSSSYSSSMTCLTFSLALCPILLSSHAVHYYYFSPSHCYYDHRHQPGTMHKSSAVTVVE